MALELWLHALCGGGGACGACMLAQRSCVAEAGLVAIARWLRASGDGGGRVAPVCLGVWGMGFGSVGLLRLRAGSALVWWMWGDGVWLPGTVGLARWLRACLAELRGWGLAPWVGLACALAPCSFCRGEEMGFGSLSRLRSRADSVLVWRRSGDGVWPPLAVCSRLHARSVVLVPRSYGDDVGLLLAVGGMIFNVAGPSTPRLY